MTDRIRAQPKTLKVKREMAKQTGDIALIGTVEGLTFYQMNDKPYVRRKSSLSGKRFRRDVCFTKSRNSSKRFGQGNRLASELYQGIPKKERLYEIFLRLKTLAIANLKEGMKVPEARRELLKQLPFIVAELKEAKLRNDLPAQKKRRLRRPVVMISNELDKAEVREVIRKDGYGLKKVHCRYKA